MKRTPYNAPPSTRNETKVTAEVDKEKKEI